MSEVPRGIIVGKISEDWAARVQEMAAQIWIHNRPNAESIHEEVRLSHLGGLIVKFSSLVVVSPSDLSEIVHRRSVVNLSFKEAARLLSTVQLCKAAREQHGLDHELTRQLERRMTSTALHGGDETWAIPVSAIDLVKPATVPE